MKRYHFICDFSEVNMPIERDEQSAHLLHWLDAILNVIDMSILSGPHLKYGNGSREGSQCGYSLVTIIDFSSICLHHFEKDRQIKIDVFSCKPFNIKLVESVCKNYFGNNISFKTIIEV